MAKIKKLDLLKISKGGSDEFTFYEISQIVVLGVGRVGCVVDIGIVFQRLELWYRFFGRYIDGGSSRCRRLYD